MVRKKNTEKNRMIRKMFTMETETQMDCSSLTTSNERAIRQYDTNKEINCFSKAKLAKFFERIPDPCLMIICDSPDEIKLNQSLSRLLGYASLLDYRNSSYWISNVLDPAHLEKLKKVTNSKLSLSGVRSRKLSLNTKNNETIECLARVMEFSQGLEKNRRVLLCVIEKILDWSELRRDNALRDILKQWDILDGTWLIVDFSGNILRLKNRSKGIDLQSNSKWGRNNIFEFISESDAEKIWTRFTQLKVGMKLPPSEYKLKIPDDKPCFIKTYSRIESYHNSDVIACTIRNISEYKEAQNEILRKIIEAEENERSRFSRDLHDELGPCLSALKMSLQSLPGQNDKGRQSEIINNMGLMLNEAIANVKALTRNLVPRNISDQGIDGTVRDMVFRLNQSAGVQINYESSGIEEAYNIHFATAIYRIVLEIINNGIRHSNASVINLRLYFDENNVNIYYDDDGIGFDMESTFKNSQGIGLRSIVNRVEHYQGSYDFFKQEPNGTVITICLPVNY